MTVRGNCTSCTIVSDDFGDGVLTGWTNPDSYTESGGVATKTTAARTTLTNTTTHPGGSNQSQAAECKVWADTVSGVARVWLAGGSLSVRLAWVSGGCIDCQLYHTVAGVETAIGGSFIRGSGALSQFQTVLLCYDHTNRTLGAKITNENGNVYRIAPAPCTPDSVGNTAGIGTQTAPSSTIYKFDDFKYLRHKRSGNCCCPDCDPGCLISSDDFDSSDTCIWTISGGTGTWVDGTLKLTVSGGVAVLARYEGRTGGPTRDAKISVKIKLPANSSVASLYCAEIQADDGAGGCGYLRIKQGGSLLAWEVPIPSLPAGQWHTLSLCIKTETLWSVSLVTAAGASYGHHAAETTGDCVAGLQTGTTNGDYYFDEFRDWHLMDVGDSRYDDCPCCSLGCEAVSDTFEDGTLDCRWSSVAGTWSETGGAAQTTSSNARLIHQSSWTGLDDDCELDNTVRAEWLAQSTAFSDQLLFIFDYLDSSNFHYALVDLASDDLGSGASLSLYKRTAGADSFIRLEGFSGALRNTNITVTVCYDQSTIKVTGVAGAVTTTFESDSTGHGGKRTGLGTGTITGTAKFLSFSKNHNIYSSDCSDCEASRSVCTGPCANSSNRAPERIKVRVQGLADGTSPNCDPAYNGTYIGEYFDEECNSISSEGYECWRGAPTNHYVFNSEHSIHYRVNDDFTSPPPTIHVYLAYFEGTNTWEIYAFFVFPGGGASVLQIAVYKATWPDGGNCLTGLDEIELTLLETCLNPECTFTNAKLFISNL